MTMNIPRKVAVVSGGAGGIGQAVVARLAAEDLLAVEAAQLQFTAPAYARASDGIDFLTCGRETRMIT